MAMLAAEPGLTVRQVWERLLDEHGATVAYPTLRAYVTGRRPAQRLPGQDNDQARLPTPVVKQ